MVKKYRYQKSDTTKVYKNIPLMQYHDFEEFKTSLPRDCKLVGIEIDDDSQNIVNYNHFQRSVCLLGSETKGLSEQALNNCHDLIYIHSKGCLNVSVTGSIVLYGRILKNKIK